MAIATLRYFQTPPEAMRGGIVGVGNFDGVHLGHVALLGEARTLAEEQGGPVVAVTFDPHPLALLSPERYQPPLTTIADRVELLQQAGADHVVVLQTTPELLALSPEYFFETIIQNALLAKGMVEGFNFRFGHQRAGDNDLLQQLCTASNMAFRVVPPFALDGEVVSSSRLREALQAGDIAGVQHLCGRYPHIKGIVGHGAQRGRTLGFPTANLEQVEVLLPTNGVYAVAVTINGKQCRGAANVGPNPTFGEHAQKIEVHILDFTSDLYGQTLEVVFLRYVRPIRTFANVEALRTQLQADIADVRGMIPKDTNG